VLELFPSSAKPGDCGTFVAVGETLFAPDFANHDGSATGFAGTTTPCSPISQTAVSGQGARTARCSHHRRGRGRHRPDRHEKDSYVTGQESYRTDVTVRNTGGGAVSGILYRAGDCYLQESDTGSASWTTANRRSAAPSTRTTRRRRGSSSGSRSRAATSSVEAGSARSGGRSRAASRCPTRIRSGESIDNGGHQLELLRRGRRLGDVLALHDVLPRGHRRSAAGPPTTPAALERRSVSAACWRTPSNNRCVSRRYFRIKLRKRYLAGHRRRDREDAPRDAGAAPAAVGHDRRPAGLPKGRFVVRITALTTSARTYPRHAHVPAPVAGQAPRAGAPEASSRDARTRQREELDELLGQRDLLEELARLARASLTLEPLVVGDLAADALELLGLEARTRSA
jgi:hypothetical protein